MHILCDAEHRKQFNYLWLKPSEPESFPDGLIDALEDPSEGVPLSRSSTPHESGRSRLNAQMKLEKLDNREDWDDVLNTSPVTFQSRTDSWSPETIENARRYCLSPVCSYHLHTCLSEHTQIHERLAAILVYLREDHWYCFWCGAKYKSSEEMDEQCPGVDEEAHD